MNKIPYLQDSLERLPVEIIDDPQFELLAAEHINRYHFCEPIVVGKFVLDAACGVGYGTSILANAGAARVDGIDISHQAIDSARMHYAHPKITFKVCDILEFQAVNEYDVIVSFETIEHVYDLNKYLKVMHSALKFGGHYIVSTPNRFVSDPRASQSDKPKNPFHTFELSRAELLEALNNYFVIEEIYGQRPYYYRGIRVRTIESIFISNRLRRFLRIPEANFQKFSKVKKAKWYHEPMYFVVKCIKK